MSCIVSPITFSFEQYDFVEAGHAPVIAKLFRFRQLFRRLLLLFREALVVLTIDFRIKFKFGTQLRNELRIGVKNKVHVRAGIKRPRHIGKLALIHFLHLLDLCAFSLKFRFQSIDNIFDRVFFALRIEHEQRLVTILHDSSVLLKLFIAETSPLSIAHFTASAARSIVDLTSGFSSSKNRLNTYSTEHRGGAAPIPMRNRGMSPVPNRIMIDSRPLWPPGPPPARNRRRPSGKARSSSTTRISRASILKNCASSASGSPLRFM